MALVQWCCSFISFFEWRYHLTYLHNLTLAYSGCLGALYTELKSCVFINVPKTSPKAFSFGIVNNLRPSLHCKLCPAKPSLTTNQPLPPPFFTVFDSHLILQRLTAMACLPLISDPRVDIESAFCAFLLLFLITKLVPLRHLTSISTIRHIFSVSHPQLTPLKH